MKKVMVSFLAGAVMATAATAYGAEAFESLIGKQIQGQTLVYNDGEPLDIALIVDGKSYAPIRSLADVTGKDVTFGEGEIFLVSPTAPNTLPEEFPVIAEDTAPKMSELDVINVKIKGIESRLAAQRIILDTATSKGMTPEFIDETNAKIIELEKQLTELQAKKAELEAQLAE